MIAIDLPPLPPDAQTVMLFDASRPATDKRFTVVNLSGPVPTVVLHTTVAHGTGSDTNADGVIERFSNDLNSKATSLGRYKVAEPYYSDKWQSVAYRLDGLDATNSRARERAVVLHPSKYVREDYAGRSWGCPALSFDDFNTLQEVANLQSAFIVIYTADQTDGWLHFNLQEPICTPMTNPADLAIQQQIRIFSMPPAVATWLDVSAPSMMEHSPMPQLTKETPPFTWPVRSDTASLCPTWSAWESTPTLRTTTA